MAVQKGLKEYGNDPIQVVGSQLDMIKDVVKNGEKDSFFVCDVNEIIRRNDVWKTTFPRIKPYYAVKCNSNSTVLEVLAAMGTGFDCASKGEIQKILSLGVDPSRIIFANPTKKISHLEYANETGVTKMTFDNASELHKVKNIHPSAELLIRIKYDDLLAKFVFGSKYGCNHTTEAFNLLNLASSLNLNVIGVCFHIGSGSKNWEIFDGAIEAARYVFDIAASLGFRFTILDIGGGFPGGSLETIEEIGLIINSALEKHFPENSVKIISEPGSYFVTTAFKLLANIISVKDEIQVDKKEDGNSKGENSKVRMYYLDVSVYGGLMPILFDEYLTMKPLDPNPEAKILPSIVWGQTLDPYDKISEGVVMLPYMEIGDWLVFEEAGAYSLEIACEFNGYPLPKVRSIVGEEEWLFLTEKVPYPLPPERFSK